MNKAKSVIAAGATLLGCVVFGGVAGAAPLPAGTCSDYGWVEATVDKLRVRAGRGTNYDILATVNKGTQMSCNRVETGGRYTACGHTNANGWIPIDLSSDGYIDGYVASACVKDV